MPRITRSTVAVFIILIMPLLVVIGCADKKKSQVDVAQDRLSVVTTLFPIYDFARFIGGDKAAVTLLLPPGMEPHNFEPRPDDIIRISKSKLFIYTNRYMEPWAETIIKGNNLQKLNVVDAGRGIPYQQVAVNNEHNAASHEKNDHKKSAAVIDEGRHSSGLDPHIWLDFGDGAVIVDNILQGFITANPANKAYYQNNADILKSKLADLDKSYQDGLNSCGTRVFLHGGHYTFGYLARRYGLEYHALSGVSSESEPSAVKMANMVKQIRQSGVHYLFAEELLSPRLTETLAAEAGIGVLKLHGAHNIGQDNFKRGVTFIQLMQENLKVLQKGLACQAK